MYTEINFKTKKEFKEALELGKRITLYSPGLGIAKENGTEFIEGPHYPEPHRWYAAVEVIDFVVVSIK